MKRVSTGLCLCLPTPCFVVGKAAQTWSEWEAAAAAGEGAVKRVAVAVGSIEAGRLESVGGRCQCEGCAAAA